ncbi:MAG: hypothetical protein RR177_04285 [Oscillospiraceae bacterium]
MQNILFVAHCILNVSSKVVMFTESEMAEEEALRRRFLSEAIEKGVQLIQLPCPEFTLYGARRWGHVSNQFDNPFFRAHCCTILQPILLQMKEYTANNNRFHILGVLGVDGSPSCGVAYTCKGDWFGSFEGRYDLERTLATCCLENGQGIFIDVLSNMLHEAGIEDTMPIVGLYAHDADKCMNPLKNLK